VVEEATDTVVAADRRISREFQLCEEQLGAENPECAREANRSYEARVRTFQDRLRELSRKVGPVCREEVRLAFEASTDFTLLGETSPRTVLDRAAELCTQEAEGN
jgi:hypothetical protein